MAGLLTPYSIKKWQDLPNLDEEIILEISKKQGVSPEFYILKKLYQWMEIKDDFLQVTETAKSDLQGGQRRGADYYI